jgi:NAD/NADP transhydrogenase alpha subunit
MPKVNLEQVAAITNSVDEDTRCILMSIGSAAAYEAVIEAVTEIMSMATDVLHETGDSKKIALALSFGLRGLLDAMNEQVAGEDEHVQSHLTMLTTDVPDFPPDF